MRISPHDILFLACDLTLTSQKSRDTGHSNSGTSPIISSVTPVSDVTDDINGDFPDDVTVVTIDS